jgi:hypothetical protein
MVEHLLLMLGTDLFEPGFDLFRADPVEALGQVLGELGLLFFLAAERTGARCGGNRRSAGCEGDNSRCYG